MLEQKIAIIFSSAQRAWNAPLEKCDVLKMKSRDNSWISFSFHEMASRPLVPSAQNNVLVIYINLP